MEQQDVDLGNRFVRVIGLLGFIVATVAFLLILAGVPTSVDDGTGSGIVMFNAFIMCAALAFAGIMITTLAQISDSLKTIEYLLEKANAQTAVPKAAPAKKKAAKTAKKTAKKTTTK